MKKKYIVLGCCLLVYIIAYIVIKLYFVQGKELESYTAGWLVHGNRYFLFVWIPTIIFALRERYSTAISIMIGCFVGMVAGDIMGTYIISLRLDRLTTLVELGENIGMDEVRRAYMHYGVFPIWFIVMGMAYGTGRVLDNRGE